MEKREIIRGELPAERAKKKKLENPIQKAKKQVPKFDEQNEESLIRQLFEEKEQKQEDTIEEDLPYYEEDRNYHKKRLGEWDVPIDEEIKYFDPELSYELSGYRPLTMEQGLDFDPEPFIVPAKTFLKNGSYTEYPPGTKPFRDYWEEQKKRCIEGYTVGTYTITGDHYFFLNFYHMQLANTNSESKTTGRNEGFSSFVAKQYEFFHYVKICELLGYDVCVLKCRGVGLSEILASMGVRPFITTRRFRTMFTTYGQDQLTPVLDKCWTQLDWLNLNTGGGMKRSRQKIDNMFVKRASVVVDGSETGRYSEIEGIISDKPGKVRGQRTERLIYDEAGSHKYLIKCWIQGDALVTLGGVKIGLKCAAGTGGESGETLEGLATMFMDPSAYGILPYKNYDTKDGKPAFSSFFIPAHKFSLLPEYIDHRGVTNHEEFRKFHESKRSRLRGKDLIIYSAEYCFYPDEALALQGDSMFDLELLAQQKMNLILSKKKPQRAVLTWDPSDPNRKKVIATPSSNSKVLILEPPETPEGGGKYSNLYVAGIDSIDQGTSDSATDSDVSNFCIVIKKRVFGLNEPKYVAMYMDRPSDIRQAYDIALKLLCWYNCQALLEYTKISIQKYFQERGFDKLLMGRPEFAMSTKYGKKAQKKLIGVPATDAVIKHGLELLQNFVNDYFYTIEFDDMLEQLINYSYVAKRKFDIVAAASICEIGDEELSGVSPKIANEIQNTWQDFGYYIDQYGRRQRGVIKR